MHAEFQARAQWVTIQHGGKFSFKIMREEFMDTLEASSSLLISRPKQVEIKAGTQQAISLLGNSGDAFNDILDLKPLDRAQDWAHWSVNVPPGPHGEKYWFVYDLKADHLKISIGKPVTFNIQVDIRATGSNMVVPAVSYEIDASQVLDGVQTWFKHLPLPRDLLPDGLTISSGMFGVIKQGVAGKKIFLRVWLDGQITPDLNLIFLITVGTTVLTTSTTIRVASLRAMNPFQSSICEARARLRSTCPRAVGLGVA